MVDMEIDAVPGRHFTGHIDSFSAASGAQFALLPPDNATGNFTKVVQRIPVKIALDAETAPAIELRPGMSVIPTIATRSAPTAQAATTPQAKPKAKLVSGGSCHVKQPLNLDASTRNAGRDA